MGYIDLGGQPEAGQADGEGHVYVDLIDKNQIVAFDSKQLKLLDSWSIEPCNLPHGLAIDLMWLGQTGFRTWDTATCEIAGGHRPPLQLALVRVHNQIERV